MRSKRLRELTFSLCTNGVMLLLALSCVLPFVLLIVASLTDNGTVVANGYSFFPEKISFDAYIYLAAQKSTILRALGNSILVTGVGTLCSLIITPMLAYPLSRKELPHRGVLTFLVVLVLLFNGGLVPTYMVYTQILHIKNTLLGQLLPNLLMNGFYVMMMKSFFTTSIPDGLIESACIDGAGEFRIFRSIIVPLSTPIFATVGLFVGVAYWNDWFNGMIYITDGTLYTLQNILNQIMRSIQFLQNNASMTTNADQILAQLPSTTIRMALATVAVVPILLLYPFFQRYFVKGITLGAMKG